MVILEAGLEEVDMYVLHRYNTIDQYIVTCLILELYLELEQSLGERLSHIWWEQGGLELDGAMVEEQMEGAEEG